MFMMKQIYFFLIVVVPLLIAVAFVTLAERKVMGVMQRRTGPHVVGFWGSLQPFADGLKLLTKQTIIPNKAQRTLFLFAPVYTFALALSGWVVIPYNYQVVIADISLGVVYLLAISTLSVYGIIIAGWSSNSKYAFFGALRAAAQMISYDVSLGLILLSLIVCTGSCNLTDLVVVQEKLWFLVPFCPLAFMFYVSSLAETNRAPFDLTEAEAELVSGYNVEYSAVGFTLFFLAEYANILLMCMYISLLFIGGWYAGWFFITYFSGFVWLAFKAVFVVFLFIWTRATLPRFRYDQLMALGWKVFLPVALAFFISTILLLLPSTPFLLDGEVLLMSIVGVGLGSQPNPRSVEGQLYIRCSVRMKPTADNEIACFIQKDGVGTISGLLRSPSYLATLNHSEFYTLSNFFLWEDAQILSLNKVVKAAGGANRKLIISQATLHTLLKNLKAHDKFTYAYQQLLTNSPKLGSEALPSMLVQVSPPDNYSSYVPHYLSFYDDESHPHITEDGVLIYPPLAALK